jgi:hypothetical protein
VRLDAPGDIDGVLDEVDDKYGVVIPLSDFLYADPHAVLTEGVLYGEYLGLHTAGGVLCHHLSFSQEDIDWQLWIDAGDRPLPRKLVITYLDEPGAPQYTALIRRWSLEPKFADDLFEFQPPEDAREIPPAEVQDRKGAEPDAGKEDAK